MNFKGLYFQHPVEIFFVDEQVIESLYCRLLSSSKVLPTDLTTCSIFFVFLNFLESETRPGELNIGFAVNCFPSTFIRRLFLSHRLRNFVVEKLLHLIALVKTMSIYTISNFRCNFYDAVFRSLKHRTY